MQNACKYLTPMLPWVIQSKIIWVKPLGFRFTVMWWWWICLYDDVHTARRQHGLQNTSLFIWFSPVSKWELKAKPGLKNAEDMTVTCRAKSILLDLVPNTAKGQEFLLRCVSNSSQLWWRQRYAAFYSIALERETSENPAPPSARQMLTFQHICLRNWQQNHVRTFRHSTSLHGHPVKPLSVVFFFKEIWNVDGWKHFVISHLFFCRSRCAVSLVPTTR